MAKLVKAAYYEDAEGNTRIQLDKIKIGQSRKRDKTYLLWTVYPDLRYSKINLEAYPITVTYDGRLCDGLCRLRTAQAMGIDDLPCIVKG